MQLPAADGEPEKAFLFDFLLRMVTSKVSYSGETAACFTLGGPDSGCLAALLVGEERVVTGDGADFMHFHLPLRRLLL